MSKKDYYEILGVARDATAHHIKKKYRSLALKHHPDRVEAGKKAEAEERFKEISEAYGVLSDPKKKQLYDQYGHAGIDQNFTTEDIFRGADFSSVFGEGGLGDIFSQFFGGGGGGSDFFGGGGARRRVQRGADIKYETDLTLEEAFSGVKKTIKVPRNEYCAVCRGTGAKDGTAMKACGTCGGQGVVVTSNGIFRMQQNCPTCGGSGKVIEEFCPECNGRGMKKITRNIDVSIPPGVDSNSRLRVRGQGEVGRDGAGDLYLYIHILPHETLTREGSNLHMDLPVSFVKASLGSEVSVKTLDGKVSMKIPQGTQSGRVFRLKGKGMPDLHNNLPGDLYVRVMVTVPRKISAEQRNLLEEFARVSGETLEGKPETITEKIKNVFK